MRVKKLIFRGIISVGNRLLSVPSSLSESIT